MAYTSNDLTVLGGGFIENTASVWLYANTAHDSEATINGSAIFSDGDKKGMKKGDLVIAFLPSTPAIYLLCVTVVTAGTGATTAADVSVS